MLFSDLIDIDYYRHDFSTRHKRTIHHEQRLYEASHYTSTTDTSHVRDHHYTSFPVIASVTSIPGFSSRLQVYLACRQSYSYAHMRIYDDHYRHDGHRNQDIVHSMHGTYTSNRVNVDSTKLYLSFLLPF